MAIQYYCVNYGSCPQAGQPVYAEAAVAPICSGCGLSLSAQASNRSRKAGIGLLRWVGVGVLILTMAALAWQAAVWGYHKAIWYDMKGHWHAETTSLFGVSLPVGINLQFDDTTATVLQQQVQILKYERDGRRMYVTLQSSSDTPLELTFRREDHDHMVFEGPLGISVRYSRIKAEQ